MALYSTDTITKYRIDASKDIGYEWKTIHKDCVYYHEARSVLNKLRSKKKYKKYTIWRIVQEKENIAYEIGHESEYESYDAIRIRGEIITGGNNKGGK